MCIHIYVYKAYQYEIEAYKCVNDAYIYIYIYIHIYLCKAYSCMCSTSGRDTSQYVQKRPTNVQKRPTYVPKRPTHV